MSASITLEPAYPGKTLNPIAFEVSTTLTDADMRIRCYMYVESTPYSDTWIPIADLSEPCVDQKATLSVGRYFKEYLDYDTPDPNGAQMVVAPNVCRRFKVEFFEFLPTDRELIAEYYQTTGSAAYYAIDELTNGQDYLIVMDKDSSDVKIREGSTEISATVPSNYLIATTDGQVANEYHRQVAPTATGYDEIQVPSGIKLKVYKLTDRTHVQPNTASSGLLGGISPELLYLPKSAPDAPTNLVATINATYDAVLSWSNSSSETTGIKIYRSTDNSSFTLLTTVNPSNTTYTDSTVTNNTYFYKISAINGVKESGLSNTAEVAILSLSNFYSVLTTRGNDSDIVSFSSGVKIQVWNDQIGSSDFEELVLSEQPELERSNGFDNGKQAITLAFLTRFEARNKSDYNFLHQGATDFIMIVVVQNTRESDTHAQTIKIIDSNTFNQNSDGVALQHFINNSGDYNNVYNFHFKVGGTSIINAKTDVGSAPHSGTHVLGVTYVASTKTCTLKVKNSLGVHTGTDSTTSNFGSGDSGGLLSVFSDEIGEILINKSVIPDAELEDIMDILYNYYT